MNISTRQSQDLDDIIFEFRQNDKTLSEKALWNNIFSTITNTAGQVRHIKSNAN